MLNACMEGHCSPLPQGLVRLNEPRVQVVTRKQDIDLVKGILSAAVQGYAALGGRKVDLSMDEKNFLPPGPSEGYKGPVWYVHTNETQHECNAITVVIHVILLVRYQQLTTSYLLFFFFPNILHVFTFAALEELF